MAKVVLDPEELRRFAMELERTNVEIQNLMSGLHGRFKALGDTWQDQEQVKFAETFEQALKSLGKFVEASERQVPYLMRKVRRAEDYLRQR